MGSESGGKVDLCISHAVVLVESFTYFPLEGRAGFIGFFLDSMKKLGSWSELEFRCLLVLFAGRR